MDTWLTRSPSFPATGSARKSPRRSSASSPRRACRSSGTGRTPASSRSSGSASRCRRSCSTRSRRNKVALKGPVTTPIGEGFTSVNVGLRKALDLFANLRPVKNLAGRREPLPERRPDHRPREHRGSLRRARARDRAGHRREHQDHHREGLDAHRAVRVRVRAEVRPEAGHGDPQGQHHEAQRRPVPRQLPQACRASSSTSPTTSGSSTPRACTWSCTRRSSTCCCCRTCTATSCRTCAPAWSAGWASCRGRTSGPKSAVFEAVHGSAPDIADQNLANPDGAAAVGADDARSHRRAASARSGFARR